FFFQAEDGIRDGHVTGVQTCALPISILRRSSAGIVLVFACTGVLISKAGRRLGRNRVSKEVSDLIFQMVAEDPTWGAPRIHGERSEERRVGKSGGVGGRRTIRKERVT